MRGTGAPPVVLRGPLGGRPAGQTVAHGEIHLATTPADIGQRAIVKALAAGARALTLDEQEPWGHLVVGLGHARRRRPELAVTHLSKSLDLNPNFVLGHAGLGYALACGGQLKDDARRRIENELDLREAQLMRTTPRSGNDDFG